jgi:general stress protein 26
MNQIGLEYQNLEKTIKNEFNKLCSEGLYKRGIIATSKDNHVTARRMRLIPDGLTLYAWTDSRSMKIDQIRSNPNVAVVAGFIQVEGKATLCGHPLRPENRDYIEAYKRKLPDWYEKVEKSTFESVDHIELIKINPSKISMPSMADTFSKDILDVEKGIAYRITGVDWTEAPAYKA